MKSAQLTSSCLFLLLLSGCQWPGTINPAPQAAVPAPPTVPTTAPAQSAAVDRPIDAPETLAQKAQEYARQMEPVIAERKAEVKPAPSQVAWEEKQPAALSREPDLVKDTTRPRTDPPVVRDVDHASGTNTGLSLVASERSIPSAPLPASPAPVTAAPVEPLERKLASRVHDYPRDVAHHLDYQLLQFINDEPVPQLAAIAPLPNEDREMITAVMDGLSNFRNNLRSDNNMLLSKKIKPLLEMSDRLRSQAELTVPVAVLCKEVRKFGDFDPIEPPRFPARKALEVILYVEVDNFASSRNEHNAWETRLTQDVVLYTESGIAVWSAPTQKLADNSRNRRRDFFIASKLHLPAELNLGRYVLKVTVVDEHANRVAESSVPMVVVAQ